MKVENEFFYLTATALLLMIAIPTLADAAPLGSTPLSKGESVVAVIDSAGDATQGVVAQVLPNGNVEIQAPDQPEYTVAPGDVALLNKGCSGKICAGREVNAPFHGDQIPGIVIGVFPDGSLAVQNWGMDFRAPANQVSLVNSCANEDECTSQMISVAQAGDPLNRPDPKVNQAQSKTVPAESFSDGAPSAARITGAGTLDN